MKRAFTLVEIVVSTMVLSLILLALVRAYGGLQLGIDVARKGEHKSKDEYELVSLLYADFVQGRDINITRGRDYDYVVIGSTKNSLYDTPNSSVAYLVSKPSKKLLRIESAYPINLPIVASDLYRYRYLQITDEIKSFKLYKSDGSKEGCTLMIFIDREKPLLFEFALLNYNSCKI